MKHSGTLFTSVNPSNGSLVWEGYEADSETVNQAVRSARLAFPEWSKKSTKERSQILIQFADRLESRKTELSRLISLETGKPWPEAKAEVGAMSAKVDISIRAHKDRCSEFRTGPSVTRFRPHGVLAVLGPYNFPGHLPNGHIVPALLAGNTVVFKPSELTPAVAEMTVDCWLEAGLPKGVLNLLQGGAETAKTLSAHPGIDGLLFTGSATTGKLLARQFSETPGKILALEMGGNNPLIVDTDHVKDLDLAVDITLNSAFLTTGQRCTCARRLLLVDSPNRDAFLDCLVKKTAQLEIDDPFVDPPPFMGPLASAAFPASILSAQRSLLEAGAFSLIEAKGLQGGTGFISPGILDCTPLADPPDEEIFGPLLQVFRVTDLETAIERANQTRFGLAAGVVTDDEARYRQAYSQLRAGIINWNTQLTGASSASPFGGVGDSGNLRPAAYFAADYCSYPVASMERN